MRILIIARGYPTKDYPLNGIFEYDQAKALAASGHEVIFAAIDLRSIRRTRRWGTHSFSQDGVHIEAVSLPLGNLPKPILHQFRQKAVKKVFNTVVTKYGRPDIIHSHFIEQGYAVAKTLSDIGIPLFHTEHYSGMNQTKISDYYAKLGNATYKKMTKVLVVSNYLRKNLEDKFGIEATVVPNIVDLSAFNAEIKPKDMSQINFITVGRLDKNKRMDLLINAFHKAFKNEPTVNLFIYGDGPERKHLEQLIQNYHLGDRVHLMGQQDRVTIAKKMEECHCFVLASRLETFGVVLIEAMAMGLPIITTKSGGPDELISPHNGILIEKDSVKALSDALIEIKTRYTSFDLNVIVHTARVNYRPEQIAQELNILYTKLVR